MTTREQINLILFANLSLEQQKQVEEYITNLEKQVSGNKPSWDTAPEWANYLAMDGNGEWFWYEKNLHMAKN